MIHYGFYCDREHEFDEWFDSMADYERKAEAGVLACPECGSLLTEYRGKQAKCTNCKFRGNLQQE